MSKHIVLTAVAAFGLTASPAFAQASDPQPSSTARERIGAIFGALFGDRSGANTSVDSQWAAGQTPLANQRSQFETRVDSEVRAGTLTAAAGTRLKGDYASLVELETRYGADRRFTTQERTELGDRYGTLTQVLTDGGYADGGSRASVADGRAEFDRRVDASLANRRITRAQRTQLRNDYTALTRIEAGYLRDGRIDERERADLDARLDALDARVGDTAAAAPLTTRARLDAIARGLSTSGLGRAAQAQLLVEHGDLTRLEAAYARINPTAEEQAYLERRVTELETQARGRR